MKHPQAQIAPSHHTGLQPRGCANPVCPTVMDPGSDAMADQAGGVLYCVPCGQRLRYHRRKALERAEVLPVTLADVDRRHEAAGVH